MSLLQRVEYERRGVGAPAALKEPIRRLLELQSNFNDVWGPGFDLNAAPFNAAKSSSPASGGVTYQFTDSMRIETAREQRGIESHTFGNRKPMML
jgi:hypothetical protein